MLKPVLSGTVTNGCTQTTEVNIILKVYNVCGLEDTGFDSWQGVSLLQNLQTGCEALSAFYKINNIDLHVCTVHQ